MSLEAFASMQLAKIAADNTDLLVEMITQAVIDQLDTTVSSRLASNDGRLNHLDVDISSMVGVVGIQTNFVQQAYSVGAGQDLRYIDIPITEVGAVSKCRCEVTGYIGATAYAPDNTILFARLTSTTNLRIHTPLSPATVGWAGITCQWRVTEFK